MAKSESMQSAGRTVIESVVTRNFCVGCGACAAVCPKQRLLIDWNDIGCYEAKQVPESEPCGAKCGLCLKVCPFADGNPNEDELSAKVFGPDITRTREFGGYRSCRAGFSNDADMRANSASGGVATWFLQELLRKGIVDKVACVAPHPGPRPLFRFSVCETTDQVERAASSAYYPVEMSDIIREISGSDAKYAVTCLPCFAKALRLASQAVPRVSRRLVCIVGLVCGHTVSRYFSDYVAWLAGAESDDLAGITFRTKDSRFPATELGTRCAWPGSDGASVKTVYWSQGPGEAWAQHWFTPNACLYCDDVFAETADIAFMDAWLPEFESDWRGTNLLIVRSELAERVLESGISNGDIHLEPCSPEDVIRSQVNVIANKRDGLSHRIWKAREAGVAVPIKRVEPREELDPDRRRHLDILAEASAVGCSIWARTGNPGTFKKRMSNYGWSKPQSTPLAGLSGLMRRALGGLKRRLRTK